MEAPDISALLADDDDPMQSAMARAAALRGQKAQASQSTARPQASPQNFAPSIDDLSAIFQATGDRVLAPLGQHVAQQEEKRAATATRSEDRRFAQALEAQRAGATQKYQQENLARETARDAATEADRAVLRRIEQQRADADKGRPITTGQGLFDKDPKTGALRRLTDPEGNPLTAPPRAGAVAADQKLCTKFKEDVSTSSGRSRIAKDLQGTLNKAEALEALVLGPGGQVQDLTPQQVREAATSLAQLITRGVVSVSQLEHLTPDTLAGKFANWKQYLLNEPAGANAQAFLQNMLETAGREKKVALMQQRRAQLEPLPFHMKLRSENPQLFDSALHAAGIDPKSITPEGLDALSDRLAPAAPQAPKQYPPQALELAKQLKAQGMDGPAIKAALRKAGY